MHDFTATERHLVILLQPWVQESFRMPYASAMAWRPELGTRVLVIDKADLGRRRTFELEPFFFFHLADAWEDADGTIRFDACIDDNPDGVDPQVFAQMTEGMLEDRAKFMGQFFRDFYGVGLLSKPVSEEVLQHSWAMAMMAGLRPTLAAAQAFATTDFRDNLPAFTVPTLVIHGTADATVPIKATAHAVVRAVPHATLLEYDGEPYEIGRAHV